VADGAPAFGSYALEFDHVTNHPKLDLRLFLHALCNTYGGLFAERVGGFDADISHVAGIPRNPAAARFPPLPGRNTVLACATPHHLIERTQ
jgi:hypothetical protein